MLESLRPLVAGSSCRPGLRVSGQVVPVRWPRRFERTGSRPRRSRLAGLKTHVARPETTCLSEEEEVAEALIAVAEAAASTVAVATTTSEGAAAVAVAAAISEAAAEEGLDEGAVVEALINSRIKDLQNVSSC